MKLKSLIIASSIIAVSITSLPICHNTVNAQEGAVSSAIAVPISTGLDLQSIMNYRKNFGLDLIATNIAKRILHTMTLDVVDWINSGFEGNPAFLSNPEGFFLDAVDQVTGKFIFEGGLTGLCSPFEIDLKAALYMGQAGYDTRYTCTLSQVINNVQNIPNNIYVNGSNINRFMGGDFTQGGWPAFIAMTTEPQNNPTGAYLKAKSELTARVNERRATINVDLNRGNGFLSWQDCKEIQVATNELGDDGDINSAYLIGDDAVTGDDGDIMSVGATSNFIQNQKVCETKTPGSVISGSINKSLGAGQDELVAADDINSIINALISTLARTVLTGGLKAFSGGGGSGNGNYSSNRYREMIESDFQGNTQTAIDRTRTDSSEQIRYITSVKSYYDQAVAMVTKSKDTYLAAKACLTQNLSGTRNQSAGASLQIYLIDTKLTKEVDPLLASLTKKQLNAQAIYDKAVATTTAVTTGDSIDTIQQQAELSAIQYAALVGISQSTVDTALADWQNAQNKSTTYTAEAQRMLDSCQN